MKRIRVKRLACLLLAAWISATVCSCGARRGGPADIDPDAPSEFSTTDSGLKYRILRKSDGRKPESSDQVEVDYTGWLDDGTIFDTSYGRPQPAKFMLPTVIAGWSEGMQMIGEGGMIELEVPPELGYGENGQPPRIPPNATLHFKIELHHIE